jgi:hypothetical protein
MATKMNGPLECQQCRQYSWNKFKIIPRTANDEERCIGRNGNLYLEKEATKNNQGQQHVLQVRVGGACLWQILAILVTIQTKQNIRQFASEEGH